MKIIALITILIIGVLSYNSVDNNITKEDEKYISLFTSNVKTLPNNPSYDDEIKFITRVQQQVLRINFKENYKDARNILDLNSQREPKDLYEVRGGLCYDVSRTLEKIFRKNGFKTRHIAIYSTKKTKSAIKSIFLTYRNSSHAITEVLTKKGWLVVDSLKPWMSLDKNNNPVSIQKLQSDINNTALKNKAPAEIYIEPFTFVYGLYSRHGKFYPPYNFIPDVHYGEFIYNISQY
jgi:hypothetical protein